MKLLSNKEWQEYRNLQGRVKALEKKMKEIEFDKFVARHDLELGGVYIFRAKSWKLDDHAEVVWGDVYYARNRDMRISRMQYATRLVMNFDNWNEFKVAINYGYTPVKVKVIKEHIEEAQAET